MSVSTLFIVLCSLQYINPTVLTKVRVVGLFHHKIYHICKLMLPYTIADHLN